MSKNGERIENVCRKTQYAIPIAFKIKKNIVVDYIPLKDRSKINNEFCNHMKNALLLIYSSV